MLPSRLCVCPLLLKEVLPPFTLVHSPVAEPLHGRGLPTRLTDQLPGSSVWINLASDDPRHYLNQPHPVHTIQQVIHHVVAHNALHFIDQTSLIAALQLVAGFQVVTVTVYGLGQFRYAVALRGDSLYHERLPMAATAGWRPLV